MPLDLPRAPLGRILPPLLGVLLALLAIGLAPSTALGQQPGPTRAQIEAATYPVPVASGGTATLIGGRFEVAAAPASASKITATLVSSANGVIGGQPGAAVVLATSGGGSGTFLELYVLDASAKVTGRASLGDRVAVREVSVGPNGNVLVQLMAHSSADPQCCPTIPQRRDYELRGSELVLVSTATAAVDPPRPTQPPRPATTGTGGVDVPRGVGAPFAFLVLASVLVGSAAARVAAGRGCPRS